MSNLVKELLDIQAEINSINKKKGSLALQESHDLYFTAKEERTKD